MGIQATHAPLDAVDKEEEDVVRGTIPLVVGVGWFVDTRTWPLMDTNAALPSQSISCTHEATPQRRHCV